MAVSGSGAGGACVTMTVLPPGADIEEVCCTAAGVEIVVVVVLVAVGGGGGGAETTCDSGSEAQPPKRPSTAQKTKTGA